MKRLLCIVGSMDMGGAETFLMKIYRALDKNKYQMDFCVAEGKKGLYEDEIEKMGGRIYRITPKTKGAWKNFNDIKRIVRDNKYKNVMRISQNSLSNLELLAARIGGAKNLIFRSSNSSVYGGKKEEIVHYLFRPVANLISNVKIAPSKEAGRFMFGGAKFTIINNGLSIDEYKFSEEARKRYRKEYGVGKETMVIGHVGRFNKQKNHKFLIDIFEEYHKKNPDSVLWLVGEGELKDDVNAYIIEKGLIKKIRMIGTRKDISRMYSAMDCFVFPSLFEGLPNAVIEAQVAGLPCLVSDTITKECAITDTICFLSLQDGASSWSTKISRNNTRKRQLLVDSSYDIEAVKKKIIPIIYK